MQFRVKKYFFSGNIFSTNFVIKLAAIKQIINVVTKSIIMHSKFIHDYNMFWTTNRYAISYLQN